MKVVKLPKELQEEYFNKIDDELLLESKMLRELDHPNIVRLIEVFRDNRKLCLITELCKGTNLVADILKRKIFSEPEAAFIIWQLLLAVNYCHKKEVSHRDIKLDNILVDTKSLHIKLIDFGHACLFNP